MAVSTTHQSGGRARIAYDQDVTPIAYTSRRGERYYLHRGTTSTGKARYFVAKSAGPEVVEAMPEGYEFCESPNGVVSVRKRS